MGFLFVFCFSSISLAQTASTKPAEPNLLVSPDIQKLIEGFVESHANNEFKKKEVEIEAMFPKPRTKDNENTIARLKDVARIANEVIRRETSAALTQKCFELQCDADTLKKIAEAYAIKNEASIMLDAYMKSMGGFITQANKQSAAMQSALNKLNTGIAEGNAKVNAWWNFFGIGEAALREAQTARVQAQQIGKDSKEINETLLKINKELKDLQDGVKNGTLSAKDAEAAMAYIQSLVADIQRLIADAIAYMQKSELNAVVAKNAPEMNLPARIREARVIEQQIIEKVAESESKKANEMKNQLLNALPIPVDITKPLAPQLKVPPKAKPIPIPGAGVATPPAEDPSVNPAPSLRPDPRPAVSTVHPKTVLVPVYVPVYQGGRIVRNIIIRYDRLSSENLPVISGFRYEFSQETDKSGTAVWVARPVRVNQPSSQ